jgi:hypothetical protein
MFVKTIGRVLPLVFLSGNGILAQESATQGQEIHRYTNFRMDLRNGIHDWEKAKGIAIAPHEREDILDELDRAARNFKERNVEKVSDEAIRKQSSQIASAYLDSLSTATSVGSPYLLFSERILGFSASATPLPNKRGVLHITVATPPPQLIEIDGTTMDPPGVRYLLVTGNHSVKIRIGTGLDCKHRVTIQAGKEFPFKCP